MWYPSSQKKDEEAPVKVRIISTIAKYNRIQRIILS